MTEPTNTKPISSEKEFASKTWDVLASAGIVATTGIPIPPSIVKSVRKAAERLINGVADYSVAFIENAAVSKRMNQDRKAHMISSIAAAAAERAVTNPELLDRAISAYAGDLVTKQKNKEQVLAYAVEDLSCNQLPIDDKSEIDDDWLGTLTDLAATKSNESVQRLLGKILAGEIRQPGSFSPLTLQVLSTLTPKVAQLFEKICNLSISPGPSKGVAYLAHELHPNILVSGIPDYDIGFGGLLILQNHGLLLPSLTAAWRKSDINEIKFDIGGQVIRFVSSSGTPQDFTEKIAPFSQAGAELRQIISLQAPEAHVQQFVTHLAVKGFEPKLLS